MSLAADFGQTLTQHVLENQADHPDARGQLSALLTQIGVASKLISAQVRRAGLIEVWGATGETNIQGENPKLNEIANDTFVEILKRSSCVAGMASEKSFIVVEPEQSGDYVVVFDPLDGSSNIDVGVSIGTIFAITKGARVTITLRAFCGRRQLVAGGYVVYGSSTVLVYSTIRNVNCLLWTPHLKFFSLGRTSVFQRLRRCGHE